VDYAAKRGTPVHAAGDGKVIFKGKKGGYGKVMIVQHGSKYTTLYAHLKTYNRKLRVGSKVNRGKPSLMLAAPAWQPARICTTNFALTAPTETL